MERPIRAKILNVISDFAVAINAGKNKGITRNMSFEISTPADKSNSRTDSGFSQIKGIVKISEVYDTFSLAERYEKKISDLPFKVGDDALQVIQATKRK